MKLRSTVSIKTEAAATASPQMGPRPPAEYTSVVWLSEMQLTYPPTTPATGESADNRVGDEADRASRPREAEGEKQNAGQQRREGHHDHDRGQKGAGPP